jgi:hypothetical protein
MKDPITTELFLSFHILDTHKGLMQEARQDLADVMSGCSYFDQDTFNKAGKTRNLLDKTLTRIAEATKRLRQLEFLDKDDLPVDIYLAKKQSIMNECCDLQVTVDKQWAMAQDIVSQDMCVPQEPVEGDYAITHEDQGIES